jgi:hypothetical protein
MTRELRERDEKYGLVLANGGTMTYQHVLLMSAEGPKHSYPDRNPLPDIITDVPVPAIDETAKGEAVVEVSCV